MSKKLSDNELEKIKQAQLAVALKRLKDGKPLTLTESRLVESMRENAGIGIAPSIAVASTRLNVPIVELKAAKRAGCPGFKHTRVDCDKVRQWLQANPIQLDEHMKPMEKQKFRKLKADADAKEFALQVKRGDYLHKDDVRSAVMRAISAARSVLNGKASGLAITLATMTGADPVELEERIKDNNREVISEMHRMPFGNSVTKCDKCGHEQKI